MKIPVHSRVLAKGTLVPGTLVPWTLVPAGTRGYPCTPAALCSRVGICKYLGSQELLARNS
eukprot:2017603-Rhodomonas_salina.1